MNTTCRRWIVAGVAWACRDAAARVDNAIPPAAAAATTAAVHPAAPVGLIAARAWRGGSGVFECG